MHVYFHFTYISVHSWSLTTTIKGNKGNLTAVLNAIIYIIKCMCTQYAHAKMLDCIVYIR